MSGEAMMGRLAELKSAMYDEIRTPRREAGKLMIAVCLERGVGYSDKSTTGCQSARRLIPDRHPILTSW